MSEKDQGKTWSERIQQVGETLTLVNTIDKVKISMNDRY